MKKINKKKVKKFWHYLISLRFVKLFAYWSARGLARKLNQIHTYLSNQIKNIHDDDKSFLFSLFDGTYAGEAIKIMNKKKTRKKEGIVNGE